MIKKIYDKCVSWAGHKYAKPLLAFEAFIESESSESTPVMIKPNIKGSAFITGEQILYKDDQDPFPEGYRLNDTWPSYSKD